MSSEIPFSVVIPTHDTRELTLRCLESLRCIEDSEILVVDDASRDGTVAEIRRHHPTVRVLGSAERLGFTAAANLGLRRARGRIMLLLNSDTEVLGASLSAVAAAFQQRPRLGIVGARLEYPDGSPQWSGGRTPGILWCFALASGLPALLSRLPGYRRVRSPAGFDAGAVDWVTGAAMAIRREVWEEMAPLDESFDFYCQDLDFCVRARQAGWQVRIVPQFRVLHHHGATISRRTRHHVEHKAPELLWSDLIRWASKHRGVRGGRRVATALRLGGWLRVVAASLLVSLGPTPFRSGWRRDRISHRAALRAIRRLPATDSSPASR